LPIEESRVAGMASKEDAAERVFDQVNWQRIARRMTVIHGQSH